jgi:DNA polymerase I-like protein with 3'-5' exonuclease and polymerase domains
MVEKVEHILTLTEMCAFLEAADENAVFGCDTEGSNIEQDYRDGRGWGTGISLTIRMGVLLGGYYPFRHPEDNLSEQDQYHLRNALRNFKGWLVFHNAKHDLVALHTLGIDYPGKFYDTLLLCHLLDETLPYDKSLEQCAKYYLGAEEAKDDTLVKAWAAILDGEWHRIPADVMGPYSIHDAALHLRLFEHIEPLVFKEVPREYWDHKQDFVRCIIAMERLGVRIDTKLCQIQAQVGEWEMADIVDELKLNPGSPKDQYKLFIEELGLPPMKHSKKTGKPSFDKEVMQEYELILENRTEQSNTARLVLNYRGWQKTVTSNYRPYLSLLSPDGRLRPNYKLHGTKTGRCSCERPNLQQIPRVSSNTWNGAVKAAFIPEDGYSLWEFDYSQLEFRLGTAYAAQYQPDIPLVEIFNDPDRDVFTEMSRMENWPRQHIKTRTYAIQYGGGANRLKNVFGLATLADGQKIKDRFFEMYPGFEKVMRVASVKVVANGKLQLWTGRYRHFMFPSSEAHKGFNSVIQGGGADIMEGAMVRVHKQIVNDECRMLLQVHDSILCEIKNGTEDIYIPKVKALMEDVDGDWGVKFRVDCKRWGE